MSRNEAFIVPWRDLLVGGLTSVARVSVLLPISPRPTKGLEYCSCDLCVVILNEAFLFVRGTVTRASKCIFK